MGTRDKLEIPDYSVVETGENTKGKEQVKCQKYPSIVTNTYCIQRQLTRYFSNSFKFRLSVNY